MKSYSDLIVSPESQKGLTEYVKEILGIVKKAEGTLILLFVFSFINFSLLIVLLFQLKHIH